MTATARLKQLLFIAAALALVGLGLVAAVSTASPARATDTAPCSPTQDMLSAWANDGDPFTLHGDATPPADPDGTDEASTTNLVKYVKVSETKHVTQAAVPGTPAVLSQWWNFSPNKDQGPLAGEPAFPTDPRGTWEGPHTNGGPDGTGTFLQGNGNASWFHRSPGTEAIPGQDEVSHTDYTWQKQTRTFTEGVDCPPPAEECPNGDFNGADPGCGTPPEECPNGDFNGADPGCGTPPVEKKVVVCKYVGTPPGQLDHIVIVSENTLNNLLDGNGDPFNGSFPFSWTDAQGQTTEGSVAIRYAVDGEQAKDVALTECPDQTPPAECPDGDFNGEEPGCGEPPVECPNGDFNGEEPGCGEPPVECPNGDFNGEEPGCGEPNQGPDCEADPHAEGCPDDDDEVCPPGTDHAGDEVKHGDDPAKVCDDDEMNPHNPGEPGGPSNHPNPGPTVKGAQATAPNGSASTPTVAAGAPAAARVPSAIDAGLAPSQRDLTDHGGPLGLLGIAGALLGAGLVGASLRPRRRRSLNV
jgi:hypothetical protein